MGPGVRHRRPARTRAPGHARIDLGRHLARPALPRDGRVIAGCGPRRGADRRSATCIARRARLAVIRARDLRKTFRRDNGDLVQALDGIAIDAPDGALTALVGPDGAGKTTFIRLVAGLLRPDAGTLEVLGLD